ncbi:hypothetical protein IT402_02040 [Candidatus Nomurabacteria bacterium]|nr:hypothetical protein [Candidatus Nomurabacteria bacterium]
MHKKTFITSLILSLFSISLFSFSPVLAQTNKSLLVASVNIVDAQIVSQNGNNLNISFSLSNKEGVQSGLYYAVELVSSQSGLEIVADQKIYEESINLAENSSIKKSLLYSAPSSLSGVYKVLLSARNSSGFPFGLYDLGEISLAGSEESILIDNASCTTNIEQNKKLYGLFSVPVSLNPGQSLVVSCDVTNKSNSEVSVSPKFEIKEQSSFGQKVDSSVDNAPVSFKPNEKKNISIKIPFPAKPQKYNISFGLVSDNMVSNAVIFDMIVKGDSATISNISLDSGYYKKGETAKMTFVWLTTTKDISMEANLTDHKGNMCADSIQKSIDRSSVETMFNITKNCKSPMVSVSIKDANGNILDQKSFSSSKAGSDNKIIFVIGGLILLIALVSMLKKNKKPDVLESSNASTSTMTILPMILLVGAISLFSYTKASADTYASYGPDDTLCVISEVYVDPSSYASNSQMTVKWKIRNTCSLSVNVRLRASNDTGTGGPYPLAELMAPVTIPAGGDTGFAPLMDNSTFTSPSPSGSYAIEFETGVDYELKPIGTGSGTGPESYFVCFIADTKVEMADGTYKNIQDVKIGDVLKGEKTNNVVLAYHRPPKSEGIIYGFNGGRAFVTQEHPFKTTEGWKSINPDKTNQENIGITVTKLEVGDVLITEKGQTKITSIEREIVPETTPLYNFVLSGDRTYFADGYLVHNKNACDGTSTCIDNTTAPYYLVLPGDPNGDVIPLTCTPGQIFAGPYDPVQFIPGCGGYYRYLGCYASPSYKACGNSTPQ